MLQGLFYIAYWQQFSFIEIVILLAGSRRTGIYPQISFDDLAVIFIPLKITLDENLVWH